MQCLHINWKQKCYYEVGNNASTSCNWNFNQIGHQSASNSSEIHRPLYASLKSYYFKKRTGQLEPAKSWNENVL